MVRNTAREIAAHLSYELSFTDKTVDELLKERLTPEAFAELAEEDPLYADAPNAKQAAYITRLVKGVDEHACTDDGFYYDPRIRSYGSSIRAVCFFRLDGVRFAAYDSDIIRRRRHEYLSSRTVYAQYSV